MKASSLGLGHVLDERPIAELRPQRHVAHLVDEVVHRVRVDGEIRVAELGVAGRQEQVVVVHRLHDVERREPSGLELLPVEVEHHRADLAAEDDRGHRARVAHDHVADFIPADVEEGRLVLGLAVQRHQGDRRRAGRVERQDDRRERAWRHRGELRHGQRERLRDRTARVGIGLEVIADHAGPDDRARLLAGHPVGLADVPLHPIGDVVLDGHGRHPAVERQHLHRRALEDRQDVDRDHEQAERADDQERQAEDGHGVGVAERCADETVHRVSGPPKEGAAGPGGRRDDATAGDPGAGMGNSLAREIEAEESRWGR